MQNIDWRSFVKKWWLSALLFPLGLYVFLQKGKPSDSFWLLTPLEGANFIIHEAGHSIFIFLGQFIRAAGGTLMQLLLPGGLAVYALRRHYSETTQLMLFWLGHSLINVSVYAADARAQTLSLYGGTKVYHDWHFMLGQLGILEYDHIIGNVFWISSLLIFILMALAPRDMI